MTDSSTPGSPDAEDDSGSAPTPRDQLPVDQLPVDELPVDELPVDREPVEQPLIEHDPTIVYRPVGAAATTEQAHQQIEGAFRYAVVVERGPRAGLAFVLGGETTSVGRSDGADIFLGDVTVSRDHARFVIDEDGLRVEDLGSTNGTYVNGDRRESVHLEPGDEVIIGKFHLVVIVGDA